MNKNLIPIGIAWVGLSLVIGLVLVLSPVMRTTKTVERTILKQTTVVKPAEDNGGTKPQEVTAKTQISTLPATVEIK